MLLLKIKKSNNLNNITHHGFQYAKIKIISIFAVRLFQ